MTLLTYYRDTHTFSRAVSSSFLRNLFQRNLRISVISFNHTIAYTCNISLCLSLAEQTQIRSSGKYNFHSTTFQLENRHSQRIMSKTKLQHFIQTHILSEQRCAIRATVYTNSMRKHNTIFSWYSSWILQFRQCFFCGSV